MILQIVTDDVVSKRYDGAPALHLSEDGNFLSVRIGHKVYDTRIKGPRWINFNVYAAGELAQRIAAMNLREGSHINVTGMFDVIRRVNQETGEISTWLSIHALTTEFASGYRPEAPEKKAEERSEDPLKKSSGSEPAPAAELPHFMGYRPFGSGNPYYPE